MTLSLLVLSAASVCVLMTSASTDEKNRSLKTRECPIECDKTKGSSNRVVTETQDTIPHGGNNNREETKEKEIQNSSCSSSPLPTSPPLRSDNLISNQDTMEQTSNLLTCQCESYQSSLSQHKVSENDDFLQLASANYVDRKARDYSLSVTGQPIVIRFRLRGVAFVLVATLVVVAVAVGVSKIRAKPTLHVTFPASTGIRKVRMFSDFPDLSQLSKNHTSLSLLSRLQLLDTQRCKDDLRSCKISVVCDSSTDQSINCRCRRGFYFMDWQCQSCTAQCPDNHYLVSSCSATTDAVCKPCSDCGKFQYEAAQCSTNRDTICIDVSFPVGILPMNKSHLPDDGIEISASYSPNVFMERLIDMEALETPMYVTNNQQSLDFVWPRLSGLDIAVSVTGVFLVPDYRDIEAVDDTALFHKLLEPSQNRKDYYNFVQNYYCRHPVPDYYSLQLEIIANRTSAAQVIRCDSQDDTVPRCPDHYKDGDRYLKWNINTPCQSLPTTKLTPLKDGPNSVVCTDETEILRRVFRGARPTTQEYMFPSRECETHRRQCEQCLNSATCPAHTFSNETYLEDNQCCGIHCYTQTSCKKTFSAVCPPPAVECATGEVNIFSLFPHFDSMDRQFTCHLQYVPPVQLYSITYSVRAPTINFNTTPQHFTVRPSTRFDHERRLSNFDFMSALHDTRLKLEEEFVLSGDHIELTHYHDSLMKPYTVRELKTPNDLNKHKTFIQNYASKSSYIQFERPFMYSSLTWYKDGCYKNVSQIYPNQTIHKEDFIPVMARKNIIELEPNKALFRNREFSYQLYHRDRAPYIKFFVERGKSVLQHLQGTAVKGKLVPGSLYGRVSWHHETSTWKLIFSATQSECPSVISLKIFTQLMTGCAGYFDLLINCPKDFTVTFNFSTGMSDLPDIFILQVNDSATSHNMVLSSVYPPVYVDEVNSRTEEHFEEGFFANEHSDSFVNVWIPIIIVVTLTLFLLIIIYFSHKCINSRVEKVDLTVHGNSEGETVALNNQREHVNQTVIATGARPRPKCYIFVFVGLYIIYSLLFTFSVTFSIIYFSHSSMWANLTNSEHLGKELHLQVNRSLHDIQKFEEKERFRLFASYQERRKACMHHLENENKKLLQDYEITTGRQVDAIFVENGTLHYFTNEIQKQNISAYLQQIHNFVTDCNKTLHSIVDRFQANYFQFIRNTANSDWLKVPRQIFLHQDGEDPNMKYLSSTQVKQFASWLEIDKSEELFAVKENVFGRLTSIPVPHVSTPDVTFPSLQPQFQLGLPEIELHHHFYRYTVLEPLFTEASTSVNSSVNTSNLLSDFHRLKRDAEMFGLSGNLKHNPDSNIFPGGRRGSKDSSAPNSNSSFKKNINYKPNVHKQNTGSDESIHDTDYLHKLDMDVVGVEEDAFTSDILLDEPHMTEALTSEPEPSSETDSESTSNSKFYILIAAFLILDVVLWVYRISWLSSQIYAARHGYADRIPTDETCKQVLEIQTAYHLPAFENPHDESSGYYVDVKESLYVSDRESDITFLQTLPTPKTKDDILQKIWNEKMNKNEDRAVVRMQKCFLIRWYGDLRTVLNRLFLSQLVWQGSVTFLAISFICVFVYCVELWLTAENFQTLVGGQSAAADVQWYLDTSDRYLHGLAQQLTFELHRLKHLCDHEVDMLTDIFFKTISLQTSMFTATLQGLCREAKGKNCDKILAYQSTGGRIVGCNFLPLQAQTFHDLSLSHMEAIVAKEVTPLVNLSHRMLAVSASVVVSLLCCRLLCQAMASTVRHFLLVTGRLPRVRVYQSEEPQVTNAGPGSNTMQRSQSWVDSCESGVYLGEVDDSNKDENR